MRFRDDNLGFVFGTFIGSIIGSVGAIFVMKKLKKFDAKEQNKKNQKDIEQIQEYYENKIKELQTTKDIKIDNIVKDNPPEKVMKVDISKLPETENKTEVVIKNPSPKDIVADIAKQYEEGEYDPADFNEGTNLLEVDRGLRIIPQYKKDYAKISRKYENVNKAIEREEQKEKVEFPHQITKENYEMSGGYKKEELIYYEQNGIFADMNDNVIDEYTEEYFGLDNLNLFGTDQASLDGKSDPYEIYLRDRALLLDFHIIYNGTEDFEKIREQY